MTDPSERHYTRWPDTEGYCTPLSAEAGASIELRVATRSGRFAVDVRRWGASEPAWTGEAVALDHPVPAHAWAEGCGWPVALEIPTGADWPSGMYEVTLSVAGVEGARAISQAFFTVRPGRSQPKARALLHLATNTYNAYNQWGGRCCYSGATHVSFERPLERGYLRRPVDDSGFDGQPETTTTGLTFSRGGYHRIGLAVTDGTGAYDVHEPHDWVFEGTGLAEGDRLGEGSFVVGYEVDGVALDWVDGHPVPTHEDGAPESLKVLATAPARLMSITDDVCEPPPLLWNDIDPPGELQEMALVLFGDMSDANVERLARGHAVMATFTRGDGEVFNAGSADWCYGLDTDPVVGRVTANVLRRFGI